MQSTKLVSNILDIGEMLLVSGAEVSRVEDTMIRLGSSYGFKKVDVFTITSTIILTIHLPNDEIITQTRRIKKYNTNFEKVEYLNQLSRDICSKKINISKVEKEIEKINKTKNYPKILHLCSYIAISFAFSVFFGGTFPDAVASGITGSILFVLLELLNKVNMNNIVISLLSSTLTALSAVTLSNIGIGSNIDKIIIGNIMLLIPGIPLTNSLRDLINGDIISGLLGLLESLLKAAAVALGFSLILIPMGG